MREFFRGDKVAGLITGTLGLAMVVFGAFGLVIVAFQRLMMSKMPPQPKPPAGFEHFDEMMRAIQGLFITYLPFMIAGGLVFGVAGLCIYRGSRSARLIAQINTFLSLVWIAAYFIASYQVMQTMKDFPMYQDPVFLWASILINLIIFLAFPAALFFILKSPSAGEV